MWQKSLFLLLYSIPLRRRQWQPTPVLLPGKSHGWRSLVGCSPRGREESDMTERLHFHFSLSCIGEGNDNPLQCFCLENPRDGGAWWGTIYGVPQSQTRLKQLSSSSSRTSYWYRQILAGISREFCYVKKASPQKIPYCMMPFIQHSWTEKITELKNTLLITKEWREE